MESQKNNTADREISISRELNAPIELVWEVWTHPDHIKNWWGPNGFSNTISIMDVKPEGKWNLVMHSPDGTDYINESIFKEIIPLKRIVYEHISYPKILASIDFEPRGNKTFISWHMLFESREVMIDIIKKHNAKEGLKQNLEKLDAYLQKGHGFKQ